VRDRDTGGVPDRLKRAVSFLHRVNRRIPTAVLEGVVGVVKRDQRQCHLLCVPLAHTYRLSLMLSRIKPNIESRYSSTDRGYVSMTTPVPRLDFLAGTRWYSRL
jgi:hypothetical protein